MILTGHFQNAYVTADAEAAAATLARDFGLAETPRTSDVTLHFRTVEGDGEARIRLAIAQLDTVQYELIQPVSGLVGVYADAVAPHRALAFHHVAMRADDLAVAREANRRAGRAIVLEGEVPSYGVGFFYADARATLGHYLEYVSAPSAFWDAIQTASKPT